MNPEGRGSSRCYLQWAKLGRIELLSGQQELHHLSSTSLSTRSLSKSRQLQQAQDEAKQRLHNFAEVRILQTVKTPTMTMQHGNTRHADTGRTLVSAALRAARFRKGCRMDLATSRKGTNSRLGPTAWDSGKPLIGPDSSGKSRVSRRRGRSMPMP